MKNLNAMITLLILFLCNTLIANNIQVTNVSITGQNTDDNYTLVQFDLSWENSWRISAGPSNYDGAWVFVKYRTNGGNWQHATLNYVNGTANGDGHTAPAGSTIQTSSDGVGAFIYRDSDGSGNINFSEVQLRWDYGSNNLSDESVVDIQVFAIEMVYVPEGSYELGSSPFGNETDNFYSPAAFFSTTYSVESENAINVQNLIGELYYSIESAENQGDQLGPIPADFPKGYGAFWCMKYEITEDQWIAFFNSLNDTQKGNHDVTDSDHKNTDAVVARNTIAYTSGNATTDAPARAINYLAYEDCAAYLDWTGLRFMTELEFEKACKGPSHNDNMLATGGTSLHDELYTITDDGTENALISNPGVGISNVIFFATDPGGPARVGILAASAQNPTREETGGTYYGIMEMSGNLYERCIGVGTPTNRAFAGTHGDGILSAAGAHNVPTWPAVGSEGAVSYRGGSWANDIGFLRVADRTSACILNSITNGRIGIRGVRTGE